ncbi:DUF4845 domain-containing protein [Leeia oryzae]|uniref:DUF4845 domain-containing protein n=1 Tax=Leeia oryzae TaxID=356662 RepID=UPI00039A953F|nr:DUF4845 domain-containing protein [Leeia oryzae]
MQKKLKYQQGVSLIGVLMWGAIIGLGLLLGFKVVPAYTEFVEVKKALAKTAEKNGAPSEIRDAFGRNIEASYIRTISAQDLQIEPLGAKTKLSVQYQYKVPLVANATLVFDFAASATAGESGY